MKKLWIALVLICALMLCFVACGEDDSEKTSTQSSSPADTEKPTESHVCEGEEWITTKDPTCTQAGEKIYICSCGEVVNTEEISILGHTYGAEATCTTAQICTECGDVLNPMLGHTEEENPEIPATCTEAGLSAGVKCSVCGEILTPQEKISALGHTEAIDAAVAPTCTETGLTEGKHCSVCNEVLIEQQIVNFLGHTEAIDAAVAPTCTETGLTEGKHCSVCNEVLIEQQIVDFLGHTEVIDVAVAPTCTETGLTEGKHCSVCNEVLIEQQIVDSFGHTEAIDAAVAPTCTETGLTEGKHCLVCSEVIVAQVVIPSGHTEETTPARAPTCTIIGLSAGVKCSVCNAVIVKQQAVPATGHDYNNENTCTVCGDYKDKGLVFAIYSTNLEEYRVTNYTGSETSVIIPSTYKGKPVGSIGKNAFLYCESLTSIEIPDSVTVIGEGAFRYCSSLESIVIPDSVTSIGNGAFDYCRSLTSIEIPESVTSIGGLAFSSCSNLVSIAIPDSVTSIGGDAFYYCNKITEVHINSIEAWCGIVFENSNSNPMCCADKLYLKGKLVTELVIPNGVTGIGDFAFSGCSSLTSIEIPNSVTSIGKSAFSGCSSLTSIEIPNSITSISDFVFAGCSSLTSIEIPNSVTSIGKSAFSDCSSLTSIEIPDSITSIGDFAFYGCSSITGIEIPNSVTNMGNDVFSNCSSLTSIEIPDSITSIGKSAFSDCSSLTSIEIPDSITSIGDFAFYGCSSITGIEIPNSVTNMGNDVFSNCSSLTSIVIPDGVTSIGKSVFSGCSNLVSIEIPHSITSIGDFAFEGCSRLIYNEYDNAYYLGDSTNPYVVLIKAKDKFISDCEIHCDTRIIYDGAFYDCIGLESIVIPDNALSIVGSAFYGCYRLTEVVNKSSLNIVAGESNYGYVAFYAMEVHRGESKIVNYNDYLFYTHEGVNYLLEYVGSDTELILPESYNGENYEIYKYSFFGNTDITRLVISGGVTNIGGGAFSGCYNLMSVTIADSVTSIDHSSFEDCYKLIEVINKSALNITVGSTDCGYVAYHAIESHSGESKIVNYNDYLFYTYEGVNYLVGYVGTDTELILPESYNGEDYEIYKNAFYCNTNITSVVVPDIVTRIGYSAFYGCNSLKKITLPFVGETKDGTDNTHFGYIFGARLRGSNTNFKTLEIVVLTGGTSIDDYAFYGCSNIISIELPDSITNIGRSVFYNCTGLTSIIIPKSVTTMGFEVFYGCTNLAIYCEAGSPSSGWKSGWNSDCSVIWGYGCTDHEYTNDCDATCNICQTERAVADHVYDNACDATCNICNEIREVPNHVDANSNGSCDICGGVATIIASKTIADLIVSEGWDDTTTKQEFALDSVVSVKVDGGNNSGKAYDGDHIRIYATDTPAGTLTISVADGYELVSVKITTTTGTSAFLYVDGGSEDICNVSATVSGSSVVINSVKNGNSGRQVRVLAIEVEYTIIG